MTITLRWGENNTYDTDDIDDTLLQLLQEYFLHQQDDAECEKILETLFPFDKEECSECRECKTCGTIRQSPLIKTYLKERKDEMFSREKYAERCLENKYTPSHAYGEHDYYKIKCSFVTCDNYDDNDDRCWRLEAMMGYNTTLGLHLRHSIFLFYID